ncbi:lactonase family protein [Methylobacterium sp. NEAU K]|uniref:lactonase family protein n=1 Tax=Methylobacterium sp. NEAU K TaxID=3064946 RepID=UPI0027333076|nr:lactonase family protein [Methylobacterium sp. NEAU K]MDP4006181.1 lactonase family protein [Methylobacterium sp. NEAU K]
MADDTPRPPLGLAFVGCFTTARRRARGKGIDVYGVGAGLDDWTHLGRVEGLENPSFMVADPGRAVLYTVQGDGEAASAFAVAPDGGLRSLGSAATGGTNSVHQALDPSGRFLIVANYASGTVALMPLRPDGGLEPAAQIQPLPGGPGPHRTEQASAHPHHVVLSPDGRHMLVPDKGLDRVFVLRLDGDCLNIVSEAVLRPGAGPRHIAFHPGGTIAFLVNELDSTVATCRWDAETATLTPLHCVPTLPPDFFGASTAAAIVVTPCGRFVYASNRGQNGIARFRVDGDRLEPAGWTPSGGRDPRFMTLGPDGSRLLVANEQGDSLVEFAIDPGSGDLTLTGSRQSPSPCTIAFL